jgi:hypothetical protein
MQAYAQTNIQLFNQLSRAGYRSADLEYLYRAYELTIRLFTGQFRASGKTFIAHLVGTASILVALRAPSPLVAAGLLHAAYTQGDFGKGGRGISSTKRLRLIQVLGEQAEQYVAQYTAQSWNKAAIAVVYEKLMTLNAIEWDIILLCLANTLEDHLDLGMRYSEDSQRIGDGRYTDASRVLQVGMAEQLGFPELAAELMRVFDEHAAADVHASLRRPKRFSFTFAPASYQRRPSAFLHRVLDGCLRRLPVRLRRSQ